jgi:hypothetical protein
MTPTAGEIADQPEQPAARSGEIDRIGKCEKRRVHGDGE